MWPPEKLETKGTGMLKVTQNQFLESLPRLEDGWFVNTTLEPTPVPPALCLGAKTRFRCGFLVGGNRQWRCLYWSRPTICMRYFAIILLLSLSVFLSGCAKPDVKYSDLKPASTATVSGGTVTIHLGSDLVASACWTKPKSRIDGQTVYVVGYRTMREQSREFVVQLPASVTAAAVSVVWIDPDGSKVSVPTTK